MKQCLDIEEFVFWYWGIQLDRFVGPIREHASQACLYLYQGMKYGATELGPEESGALDLDVQWILSGMNGPKGVLQLSLCVEGLYE